MYLFTWFYFKTGPVAIEKVLVVVGFALLCFALTMFGTSSYHAYIMKAVYEDPRAFFSEG